MFAISESYLEFFVDGKKVIDKDIDPEWTLLYYLRNKLNLCGTKMGCSEGGCGACTVMVSTYYPNEDKIVHIPVNACLAPLCSMHGLAVTTVEGIGSTKTKLHAVQERLAKSHGSQCGFCTPGFIMSMYCLLRSQPKPSFEDLKVAFQGNLCRCTGYRPIIDGFKTFIDTQADCPMGTNCCKNGINGCSYDDMNTSMLTPNKWTPYDPSQEPIFPPELKCNREYSDLKFIGPRVKWYRPTKIQTLLELKEMHPEAKLIVGNTEVGVEVKFKNQFYPVLIYITSVPELKNIRLVDNGIQVGAAVTLLILDDFLTKQIQILPEYKTRIFRSITEMLTLFAGKQIRSVASIGGNIMTGSPTSDLNPIFMAANTELEIASKSGSTKKIKLDENFFTSYRKNVIAEDEVLVSILIPYTAENEYFYAFKQSRRKEDDMAIVNIAVNVQLSSTIHIVENVRIAFGGMAATTKFAKFTCEKLKGKKWDHNLLDEAMVWLLEDLPLSSSAPGGMTMYRQSLSLSLFFKIFLKILAQINENKLSEEERSAIEEFDGGIQSSAQYFQEVRGEGEHDTIGKPVVHRSAIQQASGEAIYCDDISLYKNELHMGVVWSTKAHAKIISIDPSEALKVPGVKAFFSSKDVLKSRNNYGYIVRDEEVFVTDTCTSVGQVLGIVIAEDRPLAQRAAKMVKVEYRELQPVIVSIEDAIKYQSYLPETRLEKSKGDVEEVFRNTKHIVSGEIRCGAQDHFYLEPPAAVVVPKNEENELEVFCTTQGVSFVQTAISELLSVPKNKIVVKTKRLGGGFGGKETRPHAIILPAAFAANKLGYPVRVSLERDEDMLYRGTRHPFLMKYKVAFDDYGTINALQLHLYVNAGRSTDLSFSLLGRAALNFFSTYRCDNIKFYGICCKTNIQTCTALRGYGSPQIILVAENIIRDIADELKKDVTEIIQRNMFRENDVTLYHQKIENFTLNKCFEKCLQQSNYFDRKKEIDEFNSKNRWKKRGITIVPLLYGIGFSPTFMNVAAALVHVYTDGSVLLSYSGLEMGQGLHTKMTQIASKVLEIPISKIYISETSTDKVPNTILTAGSIGSDYNGPAVMDACQKIMQRLEPIKKKNPNGTWEQWVTTAFYDRINLSATGFYRVPEIGYDILKNEGRPFNYFTFGAGCSEVVIDCLTGHHQVLRVDIVMDLGKSLNPAVDIGQIEGAFLQGYGYYTLEEMVYSPEGQLLTKGPSTYKLPGLNDIPIKFNVSLLEGVGNPRAVYSSKAVGEPPLSLSVSVFYAIKEAIKAARRETGADTKFILNAPATVEKIRMACEDHITTKIKISSKDDGKYWNVIP